VTDCVTVDCTPDKVLEEMGLKRKGDLYGLKKCVLARQGHSKVMREKLQNAKLLKKF